MNIPSLSYPRHLQSVDDVLCSKHFRVDNAVDAHLLEESLVYFLSIFRVVDLSHSLIRAKGMRHCACRQVCRLVCSDSNKQVSLARVSVTQSPWTGAFRLQCKQVIITVKLFQRVSILIKDGDVVIVA